MILKHKGAFEDLSMFSQLGSSSRSPYGNIQNKINPFVMEEKFSYLTIHNILSPCCEDGISPAYWSKITGEDGGEMLGKSKVSRWSQTY